MSLDIQRALYDVLLSELRSGDSQFRGMAIVSFSFQLCQM